MFYSQFILAKKGPLGTIWIAAHLERKLRKNQVADTDIGVSVDSILFPDVPIALRLSSHLLLGVVRIYSRKVNYLFDDCSEALLKIKQAFRSTAVDLPPEESTAPYHSITLPETFDLDDFELPDNDVFQGNYVDHHISTREQITLQDTMEGVVYSTSQFGLDERFGDGDTSQVGLDLDEDLFLDKVEVARRNGVSEYDPEAFVKSETPEETDASCGRTGSSDAVQVNGTRNKIEYLAANSEFDFAQAPSTPGLMEEPNLTSVQKDLVCDDHLESDDHNVAEVAAERAKNSSCKSDIHQTEEAISLSEGNHLNHDIVECTPIEDNGCLSGVLEMNRAKITEASVETVGELDDSKKSELTKNGGTCNNEPKMPDVDGENGDCGKSVEVGHHEAGDEIPNSTEVQDPLENALASNAVQLLEQPSSSGLCDAEAEACQGSLDPENLKHHVDNEQPTLACISVLHPCNSHPNPPDTVSSSYAINNNVFHSELQSEDIVPCLSEVSEKDGAFLTSGSSTKMQGEECHLTDAVQPEENQMIKQALSGEILADAGKQDEKSPNAISNEDQSENLISSMTSELPAPEKMLSVPQISIDKPEDLLLGATPEKEILEGNDGSGAGTKTSARKRSFAESSLVAQSVNLVESFGVTKPNRTVNTVPDDDDLLSSILVGRKSSVLKLKPTPVLEAVSTKRARYASRPTVLKRKVLMDDSMVLLGDTIRQQLTNTEDIRRLRKKAPCTRAEILLIQRQFLEEEIFTEPLLTGLSEELSCLHRGTFDLSGIKISSENNAYLEAEDDKECSAEPVIQHSEMEGSGRILICRNNLNGEGHLMEDSGCIDAVNNNADHKHSGQETLGEVADMEIQSANANICQSAKQSVVQGEISGDFCNMSSGFVDQSVLRGETICDDASLRMDAAATLPSDKMDTSTPPIDKIDSSTLPSGKMDTQLIDFITSEDMTNEKGFDGIGTAHYCTSDIGAAGSDSRAGEEISFEVSELSAPTEVGRDVPVNGLARTDAAENFLANDHVEACKPATIQMDKGLDDTENEKLVVSNDNGDTVVSLRCDDKEQISSLLHNDHCSAGVDEDLNRASLDDGNYPVYQEADQQRTMDEGGASLDRVAIGHSSDSHVAELVNDTDFLNVDDDEVGEDDEDGMPGDEDAHLLENSGWSSRTRAVAKYLQTLFNKEAGHGRKALSVDNLLVGKTRKEASRMFFETLVLKTRDYVHVDQEMPFDNISIKPKAKFMKSIF